MPKTPLTDASRVELMKFLATKLAMPEYPQAFRTTLAIIDTALVRLVASAEPVVPGGK